MRRPFVILCIALITAALSACGGGGGSSSSSGGGVSPAVSGIATPSNVSVVTPKG